jgi:hypothetical protein
VSDLRQQLLSARKDIETKAGIKFTKESLALADLISEFVAVKVLTSLPSQESLVAATRQGVETLAAAAKDASPSVGTSTGKPSDNLYFND